MKNQIYTVLISILFAATAFGQGSNSTIRGKVFDQNGAPISGAVVQVKNGSGVSKTVTTDSNGEFSFANLPRSNYRLTVQKAGFAAYSQDVPSDSSNLSISLSVSGPGATVTVEGEAARVELDRVPGSTALVQRREIQNTLATNLKDVLNFTPGVLAQPRFGSDETQLSVRGSGLRNNYHARGINILINGLPYGDADGMSDFESLEFLTAERVEVWKGANALRYGGNSAGGAINLVTETGETAFPLEFRFQGGSFGSYKGYLSTGGKRGRFGYFVGVSDSEFSGYRQHSTQGRRRLFGNFAFKVNENTDLYGDVVFANFGEKLPGALNFAELRSNPRQANPENVANDWGRFVNYTRGAFGVRHRIGSRHEISANVSAQYRDLIHPIFQVLDQDTRTFSGEIKYNYTGTRNRFVIGFAPQVTLNGERRFANLLGVRGPRVAHFDTTANNYGIYFENQFDVSSKFTLVTGGRVDFAKRRYTDLLFPTDSDVRKYKAFSPKVGFVWRVEENNKVFANLSRSYEPPILGELTSYGAPGFLPLNAQDTWQFELGTRGNLLDRRLNYEIAFYNSEIRNEVINQNVQPFPGAPFTIPSFRSAPRTRHTGLELSTDATLANNLFVSGGRLGWRNSYTFSNFKFTEDPNYKGNFIPGAPKHILRSEFRYDHPKGFWIAPNVDWSPASYFVDSANSLRNDSYAVFNLRAGYDRRRFGIFFEANNLGDRIYSGSVQVDAGNGRYFEPGNGRSAFGGFYIRLGK